MGVRRVVPDIRASAVPESREFYGLLGGYPLGGEDWGVRRFFVRDPGGRVNVLSHR